MEKEKLSRKGLPDAPELPRESSSPLTPNHRRQNNWESDTDPFASLYNFREREATFFKSLNESIKMFDSENSFSSDVGNANVSNGVNKISCEDECYEYILPLMSRTQSSIAALLATKDSLDQLDNLHRIVKQLLSVQEQNRQIRKRLRIVKTLHALKSMEVQMNINPDKFIRSSMEEGSEFDINEIEENMATLENLIAAGASASNKRSMSKKQRSKSIISEDFVMENDRNYPLRRQSAIGDFKPKVSKWTKVKAAFKWEKTNALPLVESKSSDSILSPNNSELARYLRVPTNPHGCSSGDSLFSASSGGRLGTPPEISSAASSADENDEEKTATRSRDFTRNSCHDDDRRSHSLDGDLILGPNILHQLEKNKNRSAWSKVKGIVASRNSRKSVKSTGSINSRDVSPIELAEQHRDRTDSLSSSNQPSPSHAGFFNLNLPDVDFGGTSSGLSHNQMSSDDNESRKSSRQGKKSGSRKSKHVPEIESLLEGVPLGSSYNKKPIPNPLTLHKDFSESEGFDGAYCSSPTSMNVRNFQRINASSVPNSPSKASEFFSENDFSSGGDYSESPLKRGSNNSSKSSRQQDEILKNYQELQQKINLEFEKKKTEWEKLRPLVIQLNNSVPNYIKEDFSLPSTPKNIISNIALNEENLSADFKKKLDEWRTKKSQQSIKESSKKQQQQQPDWNLWKTGQMKFENQGLIALPDAKDLPEDFQKKLNEWKQMKTEGRVPAYTHQTSMHERMKRQFSKSESKSSSSASMKKSKTFDDKPEGFSKLKALVSEPANKEIVVKTSKGTMTFQGISRKFTRKLYEWEKAKGIAPESSTFALLHPDYKAMLENADVKDRVKEKSPGLKRCLSVDSVKPMANHGDIQMSHQPSSLSLNDAENFKQSENSRRVVSNIEIYQQCKDNNETENDEPEAMLVEIEDESYETVSNATPITQMQIPIFKFDFANRDSRHAPSDCIQAVKDIIDVFENANNSILDIYKTNQVSITNIKHLTNIFKYINHSLIQLRESSKEFSSAYLDQALKVSDDIAYDFEQVDNSFSEVSLLDKLPNINRKSSALKDSLLNLETFYIENRATSVEGFQAKRTVQNSDESQKAVATVKVTPTFVCNSVKVNEVTTALKIGSDSEPPGTSTGDVTREEKVTKKVTRNTSNGSKRKVRLKRMGSRQSSKTESDSEDDQTANPDVTRKVKRKTSRAKKQLESDKSIDSFQGEDEVAYVFKIKPGEKNEVLVKQLEVSKSLEELVLISPTENSVQIIEPTANGGLQNLYTNAIVKTRRKIFTPVEVEDGTVNTTISQELESSSASDKNENEKRDQQLKQESPIKESEPRNILSSLPPLPSPKVQRKSELPKQNSSKDLSPSIKLMINRYNFNIDKKSNSPNSSGAGSGSCSPIWRSPILDRRVLKQSEEYNYKLLKSNSSRDVIDNEKEKQSDELQGELKQDDESGVETITEKLMELKTVTENKGAIPKEPKPESFSDTVTMRSDSNKPRTPLSERAMKIKQAKEAFLRTPLISHDSSQSDWSYRLSQISVGSTDSNAETCSLIKCLSAGVLEESTGEQDDNTSAEMKSMSLPRNNMGNDSESVSETSKGSRFGLSSLATKLRKVKLKRNTKEVKKMNTVPVLCRQSLAVDFSASNIGPNGDPTIRPESSQGSSRFRKNKHDNIKKSKSLGIL